jgi:hypothetical protein
VIINIGHLEEEPGRALYLVRFEDVRLGLARRSAAGRRNLSPLGGNAARRNSAYVSSSPRKQPRNHMEYTEYTEIMSVYSVFFRVLPLPCGRHLR